MTPEREHEIRSWASQFHHNSSAFDDCDGEEAIHELLAEIDALRVEKQEFYAGMCQALEIQTVLQKERDQLKAENEKFKHLHDEYVLLKVSESKLRKRIAKLRLVIEWASPCGEKWVILEHHPTYETIGKAMQKALTQDDEVSDS